MPTRSAGWVVCLLLGLPAAAASVLRGAQDAPRVFEGDGAVAAEEDSRAAWNGRAWLLVWNRGGQILAVRVSAGGDALGDLTRVADVGEESSFAVASDGEGWLVVWTGTPGRYGEIRGSIVRGDGALDVGAETVLVPSAGESRRELALGYAGGAYVLAWSEPTPDRGADVRVGRWTAALSPVDPGPWTLVSTAHDDLARSIEGSARAFHLSWRESEPDAGIDRARGTFVSLDGLPASPDHARSPTAPVAGDASIPSTWRPEISEFAGNPSGTGAPPADEMVVKAGESAVHRLASWVGEGPEIQSTDCSIEEGVLFCSAETRILNGTRHSGAFPSIRDALIDLPPSDGRLNVDPDEDDPTPFVETNPASASDGRKDAVVIDSRRGGIRFLSSAPEYPSGPSGRREERVPFVFQTRLDDAGLDYDDDLAAIGEWNCAADLPGVLDEWRNCPNGNASWGIAGGNKQYWHSGQCNANPEPDSAIGTAASCGGPHILEVRYPERPGVQESKPVFAVGNGGVSIYQPDDRNHYWRSWLTMFRGDPAANPAQSNTPMYVFDSGGAYFDGGTFLGNTFAFPSYTRHVYPSFNAWVQKDVPAGNPALVVEGGGNNLDAEQVGPLVRFLDRTCCSNWDHTFAPGTNHRESFGFYANSVLKLGSFATNAALDRGQYIEWEGLVLDDNETRLRVEEPTAPRAFTLPDAPDASGAGGKVQVASGVDTHGTMMWGNGAEDFDTGEEVCAAAGLDCVAVKSPDGAVAGCGADQGGETSYFFALCK